jgi:type II secretory pathway pseudopilin PulG
MIHRRRRSAITLLELLVVLAVVAIAAGIAAMGWRGLTQREEARAALVSLRHALWQGATSAAARGSTLTLSWDGDELVLFDPDDAVVRRWDFASTVPTSLEPGPLAAFMPPGRLATVPEPFTVEVNGRVATVEVSLIGETEVSW